MKEISIVTFLQSFCVGGRGFFLIVTLIIAQLSAVQQLINP